MNNKPTEPSNAVGDDGIDLALVGRLVTQAKAGDKAAFGELVKTYHTRVYSVIYRMVNHAEDSRDLAQQTWVKAWKRLGSYKEEAKFFTWLYRVAVNTAMDHLRARARNREVELNEEAPLAQGEGADLPTVHHETPAVMMDRDEIRQAFFAAREDLSPEHKAVLVLREVEGRSYEEIAEITGSRSGTVMSRVFYARKQIQEKLKGFL